jgi:putative protease
MPSEGVSPKTQAANESSEAQPRRIELLAPAKDGPTAQAAIQAGADAVYIGAPRFSAREAAGNTLETIEQLAAFAHQFYARVYVALNTLLRDRELPQAETMIRCLWDAQIDGLIIQDPGLLQLDLPPIPLIASTQMDNATPDKVKFWQDVGFTRVILARELTLDQIRQIRRQTSVELECFIHGALCVGASGQCYMSYAAGGRSGNRGSCAQPCRHRYTLTDDRGNLIAQDRHLLSLKDLNLSDHLEQLIEAGIDSFKIEGRLKDILYVVNTVAFYRRKLDPTLAKRNLRPTSSGAVELNFEPDPARTFNRGFTDYGLTGQPSRIASMDTPKSKGRFIGIVKHTEKSSFRLDRPHDLHNADGICFLDSQQNLAGTIVNRVQADKVYPQDMTAIRAGQEIHRNHDRLFAAKLTRHPAHRKIRLAMRLCDTPEGLTLSATDEDGNEAAVQLPGPWQQAEKQDAARQTITTQLTKLGNTIFTCTDLALETRDVYFLPVSRLNAARRQLVDRFLETRAAQRPRPTAARTTNTAAYPHKHLTYQGNVLNAQAETFYRRHGVETIAPAAESGLDMAGRLVMTTKLCLRKELGICPGYQAHPSDRPWTLQDQDGRQYHVRFRCGPCGMDIYVPGTSAE